MQIREARPGDEEELVRLFTTLDEETSFMLLEPGERKTSVEGQAELIRNFSESGFQALFVACEDVSLAGFIGGSGGTANRDRRTIHIAMGVLASHWGKSIGRQLLQRFESWAKTNGFHRIELTVMENNERAKRLYEKSGFEYEGTRRDSLKVEGKYVNERYMAKLI